MEQYLELIQSSVATYGVWFVMFFLFLENIPIIGLIAPGLTILVLTGFLYELILPSPLLLFTIAWTTIFLADTLWFILGRLGNRQSAWFKVLVTKSPKIEEIITKQNVAALLFYQFMAYFRMFLPFSLGVYGFSFKKWLVICLVASFMYTAVFFGIGYAGSLVAQELDLLDTVVQNINKLLAVFAIIYGFVLIRKYRTLKKQEDS